MTAASKSAGTLEPLGSYAHHKEVPGMKRARWIGTIFATVREPITWCVAMLFVVAEVTSLYPFNTFAESGTFSDAGTTVAQLPAIALYAIVFAVSRRLGSLAKRTWLFAALPILGILGMLLCLTGSSGEHTAYAFIGGVCVQTSSITLALISLELLSSLSLLWVRRAVMGGAVINAVLVPLSDMISIALGFGSLIVSGLALWRARARMSTLASDVGSASKRSIRFPRELAFGFFIVVLAFGFLQSMLYQESEGTVIAVVTGTKLIAALIYASIIFGFNDTGYALLAKTFITLTVGAFVVYLAQSGYSPLSSGLMATGYSLLEMALILLMADLASYSKVPPLRIFSSIMLIESAAYAIGCALVDPSLPFDANLRLVSAALALALVVCAVWIFNEQRINAFLWEDGACGEPSNSEECDSSSSFADSDSADVTFAERVALTAMHYQLSPREKEVLELFAAGRSAAFIGELMFVTTNTVRSHVKHIYSKCDVHSRQELITLIEQVDQSRNEAPDEAPK